MTTLRQRFDHAFRASLERVNATPRDHTGVWYNDEYKAYCDRHAMEFPLAYATGHANPEYWIILPEVFAFQVRPGKQASAALRAFLSGLTIADCGNILMACQYAALLELFGDDKFDALFPGLQITTRLYEDFSAGFFVRASGLITAGQICHFRGVPFYPLKHPAGSAGGWNVLCVGEDQYIGFDPDIFANKPLTLAELNHVFIEEYNLDRNAFDNYLVTHASRPELFDMVQQGIPDKLNEQEDKLQTFVSCHLMPDDERLEHFVALSCEAAVSEWLASMKPIATTPVIKTLVQESVDEAKAIAVLSRQTYDIVSSRPSTPQGADMTFKQLVTNIVTIAKQMQAKIDDEKIEQLWRNQPNKSQNAIKGILIVERGAILHVTKINLDDVPDTLPEAYDAINHWANRFFSLLRIATTFNMLDELKALLDQLLTHSEQWAYVTYTERAVLPIFMQDEHVEYKVIEPEATVHHFDVNTTLALSRGDILRSLLGHAAYNGFADMATYLVEEKSADVNARDVSGHTPLHYAKMGALPNQDSIGTEHAKIKNFLLSKGVEDPDAKKAKEPLSEGYALFGFLKQKPVLVAAVAAVTVGYLLTR